MTTAWLHIVGIGADGWDGLRPSAQQRIATADVIMGAQRHFALCGKHSKHAHAIVFPPAMQDVVPILQQYKNQRVVVLTTGDPLWYSIGERIKTAIPQTEIVYHPNVSAFQWAAARMQWSLTDVECLTIHGRAVETLVPYLYPHARLLVMTTNMHSPQALATLLTKRGFGASLMVVLGALGGAHEIQHTTTATECANGALCTQDIPDLHMLAIQLQATIGTPIISPAVGIDDSAFVTDGTFTKHAVRTITIAQLMPMRGAMLWDVGCGAGTVAIEWVRAAPKARAIGFEKRADRCALAEQNARALGAKRFQIKQQNAPQGFADAPRPNAVFIGGGVSYALFDAAWDALQPHGRLVLNSVTTDSEAILIALHRQHGGALYKIGVHQFDTLDSKNTIAAAPPPTIWRPHLSTTQLALQKTQ